MNLTEIELFQTCTYTKLFYNMKSKQTL